MELPDRFVSRSSLTRRMIESLQAHARVEAGEITLAQAAGSATSKPVTVGSYYRTVKQGNRRLEQSFHTVLLALWIGLVEEKDTKRLMESVGKALPDLDEEGMERLVDLTEALIARIVMRRT